MGRRALALNPPTTKLKKTQIQSRKATLKKQLYEISTLCGIDCLMIIYDEESPCPDVTSFSSSGHDTRAILDRYRASSGAFNGDPAMGSRKRKRDQSLADVLEERKRQAEKQLARSRHQKPDGGDGATEGKCPGPGEFLSGMNGGQRRALMECLDAKISSVKQRIQHLKASLGSESSDPKLLNQGSSDYALPAIVDLDGVGCSGHWWDLDGCGSLLEGSSLDWELPTEALPSMGFVPHEREDYRLAFDEPGCSKHWWGSDDCGSSLDDQGYTSFSTDAHPLHGKAIEHDLGWISFEQFAENFMPSYPWEPLMEVGGGRCFGWVDQDSQCFPVDVDLSSP